MLVGDEWYNKWLIDSYANPGIPLINLFWLGGSKLHTHPCQGALGGMPAGANNPEAGSSLG